MAKTIYLNLEDDVTKVVSKLKREKSDDVVLVFPKKSFIFSDSINLRLLKKQLDLLGKNISILTMDERGKNYAEEAGFILKTMPRSVRAHSLSDIRVRTAPVPQTVMPVTKPRRVKREEILEPHPIPAIEARRASERAVSQSQVKKMARPKPEPMLVQPLRIAKKDNVFMPPSSEVLKPPKRRSYRAYAVGFVALALIIALLLVLVVLPSANITVYAKTQSVARDLDVIANTSIQTPQSSNLTVPAVAVNESKTINDDFQVNGKKEVGSKAEGRVSLYNLTGQPLALKAATTTLTVGNKSYVFKNDQPTVKPLTSAANDSNATVADIIATEGGESFNVPAGTRVEITNQAFGSQPQRLYAKTVTQVVGGSSRYVSVISKDDLDSAQKELIKKTVASINSGLANNAKLVDGAYTVNVESFETDKPEGTETQVFAAQVKVTITGLAFDEKSLKGMIRQRLLTTLGSGKELQELEKDSVIYQIKNLDVQNGIMQLSVHYESNSKPSIRADEIKNKIVGKSKQEASDLILSNPDVDRVEMTVQPAWQSGLPKFASKITLEIKQ